jgi:hypothetical protein
MIFLANIIANPVMDMLDSLDPAMEFFMEVESQESLEECLAEEYVEWVGGKECVQPQQVGSH